MKTKLLCLLLICTVLTIGLVACTDNGASNDNGSNGSNGSNGGTGSNLDIENLIYSKNSELFVVYATSDDGAAATELSSEVHLASGNPAQAIPASERGGAHEIVIGECDREISVSAYKLLRRDLERSEKDSGYLIYSDGSSIAIAYLGRNIASARAEAVEYFIGNFVSESLAAAPGNVASASYNELERLEALDEATATEGWSEFAAKYGNELADSLKALYSIYDDNVVDWLANLYDGDVGGFYFSNSARNYLGFLPDVESTYQALSFLDNSGMTRAYGKSSFVDALPDEMKAQIISFVKGLQYANGYFYHPQWGQQLTDSRLSRRGRDLTWSTNLLKKFGVSPTYDTPNGMTGDGIFESPAVLTSRLSTGASTAVSKIVVASSEVADHLKNKTNFLAYLNSLDIKFDSYTVGNELAAQTAQITQRDKYLEANEGYSLMDTLIEWLNEKQNPETGCWDYTSPSSADYSVYRGMDGLFKILHIYNEAGAELPHAKEALASTRYCIDVDTEANIVCDVYNTWYTIDMIFENLEKYSKDRYVAVQLAKEEREKLFEEAPELIRASAKKILKFIQPDGAFEFQLDDGKSYESQGVPVSVPGIEESNVNATVICVSGLVMNIYAALDIPLNTTVPIYGASDMQRFLDIISELTPVVKKEISYDPEYSTFEYDEVGKAPTEVEYTINSTGNIKVVERADKTHAMSLNSNADGGDMVKAVVGQKLITPNAFVFESDICINGSNKDAPLGDLSMYDENGNRIYMLYLIKIGDEIRIADVSSSDTSTRVIIDFGRVASVGEWFSLKVEYFVGDNDTFRAKIYLNGKLLAVSDNYFDSSGLKLEGGVGTPRNKYNEIRLSVFSYIETEILLDNITAYHSRELYEKPANTVNLVYAVDYENIPEKKYDFENADGASGIYSDFELDGDAPIISSDSGNSAMTLNGTTELTLPINIRETKANCTVFESKINFKNLADKAQMLIIVGENGYQNLEAIGFAVLGSIESGVKTIELYEYVNGSVGNRLSTVKLQMNKECVLRIEYYEDAQAALIYLDEALVGMSAATYENARLRRPSHLHIVTNGKIEVDFDNILFEEIVKSYADASRPQKDEIVYDFTSYHEGVSTNGTIKSGALELSANGYLTMQINRRGVVANTFSYSSTLNVTALSEGKNGFTLEFVTESGKTVVAYSFIVGSKMVYIYELTANDGGMTACIGSFAVSSTVKLGIEFFINEATANIYVNDMLAGISSAVYDCAEALDDPDLVKIFVAGDLTVRVDNVIAELNFKNYEKFTPEFSGTDEDVLGFESSSSGILPSAVSAKFSSLGASLKVRELITYGKYSRVLEFTTGVGANDTLTFSNGKGSSSANCSVTSFDICFDATARWDTFKFFVGESTEKYVYSFSMAVDYGVVYLDCIGIGTDGNSSQLSRHVIGKENEWFHLTMEYYYDEDVSGYLKIYCNGVIVAEQSGMFGTRRDSLTEKDFENLSVYSYSSTKATLWFDNVSLECVEKEFVNTLPEGKGEYYNAYKDGTASGTVYDFSDGSTSCVAGINGGSASSVAILTDAKYLSVSKTVDTTTTVGKGLNFSAAESTDQTVIEMDIRINGDVNNIWPLFKIGFENRGYSREIYLGTTSDGMIKFANGMKNAQDGFVGFESGKWYNLRIVVSAETNAISNETGYAQIYIDNTYVCDALINGKGTTTKDRVTFTQLAKAPVGCTIEIDNVFVGHN